MKKDKVRHRVPLDLEERNEWFNSLTRAEKRVEVAKELVWLLQKNLFRATHDYFVAETELQEPDYMFENGEDLQPLFEVPVMEEEGIRCEGCGIAGMFLAAVRLGNKVKAKHGGFGAYFSDDDIHNAIKHVFTSSQLDKIEYAYEQVSMIDCHFNIDEDESYRIEIWRESRGLARREKDTEALIAICKNIVKNKGEFVA